MPAQEENHTFGQNKDNVTEKGKEFPDHYVNYVQEEQKFEMNGKEIFTTVLSIKMISGGEIKNGQIQMRYRKCINVERYLLELFKILTVEYSRSFVTRH